MKKNKGEKKRMDPKVKSTLISCIAALLCVAIVIWGSSSIADKISKNKVKVAEVMHGGGEEYDDPFADVFDFADDGLDEGTADAGTADEGTADAGTTDEGTADAGTADAGTADAGTADNGSGNSGTAAPSGNGGSSSSSSSSASKAKSTAEILNIYNAATKKAFDAKVPFSKTRNTVEKKFEAGAVLTGMKDIVYKFMGVGDKYKFSETITKESADSYHKYLQASRLTAADVTKASIKESGGTTTIILALKDGSSKVADGKLVSDVNNTALDKSGISQGQDDKDYWDHKNAQNIFAAIDDVPGCKGADISESYSNAQVQMVIDSKGNLQSLTVKFGFKADMDDVMGSSGTAEASSLVTMNNFKW